MRVEERRRVAVPCRRVNGDVDVGAHVSAQARRVEKERVSRPRVRTELAGVSRERVVHADADGSEHPLSDGHEALPGVPELLVRLADLVLRRTVRDGLRLVEVRVPPCGEVHLPLELRLRLVLGVDVVVLRAGVPEEHRVGDGPGGPARLNVLRDEVEVAERRVHVGEFDHLRLGEDDASGCGFVAEDPHGRNERIAVCESRRLLAGSDLPGLRVDLGLEDVGTVSEPLGLHEERVARVYPRVPVLDLRGGRGEVHDVLVPRRVREAGEAVHLGVAPLETLLGAVEPHAHRLGDGLDRAGVDVFDLVLGRDVGDDVHVDAGDAGTGDEVLERGRPVGLDYVGEPLLPAERESGLDGRERHAVEVLGEASEAKERGLGVLRPRDAPRHEVNGGGRDVVRELRDAVGDYVAGLVARPRVLLHLLDGED